MKSNNESFYTGISYFILVLYHQSNQNLKDQAAQLNYRLEKTNLKLNVKMSLCYCTAFVSRISISFI